MCVCACACVSQSDCVCVCAYVCVSSIAVRPVGMVDIFGHGTWHMAHGRCGVRAYDGAEHVGTRVQARKVSEGHVWSEASLTFGGSPDLSRRYTFTGKKWYIPLFD